MAKVLDMPKLSPTMEEGQISAWHKNEGDDVEVDDLLAEVETDKATMEFRSFDKGTLLKILVPAGGVVKLGQPVAILGKAGEDISQLAGGATASSEKKPAAKPVADNSASERGADGADRAESEQADDRGKRPAPAPQSAPKKPAAPPTKEAANAAPPRAEQPAATAEAAAPSATGRVKASPYVRKLARERGLDLASVGGSGPGGRIVARDVEGREGRPAGAPGKAPQGELASPEARPLTMKRKAIARRLTESKQTVPHFYLSIDVDAEPLVRLREQVNADLTSATPKKRSAADGRPQNGSSHDRGEKGTAATTDAEGPPKLSLNDFLIKACAIGLRRVPECNAQYSADALLIHRRVDISVAVAVPDGLITPVVRDADQKSVLEIAGEVRDLAARARSKKLRPEEMSDGTFSISNLGMFGVDDFAAVINPPEGAILAVGQVRKEPVVRDEQVVPGLRMGMTLSCDHRVVDGAVGATFLKALRELLEHPAQLLVY